MVKIISFEGCVGVGKTSLTNYFSYELKCEKILETYEINPFLKDFYAGLDVTLETEVTFLLIHYSQLKKAIKECKSNFILSDFSIQKDLVYAKLNLNEKELKIFEQVYNYVINKVRIPYAVIYIDLSLDILRKRIFQRGRPYETNADPLYFKKYNDKVKKYFRDYVYSKVFFFNVDDLDLDPNNTKLKQIRKKIIDLIKNDL